MQASWSDRIRAVGPDIGPLLEQRLVESVQLPVGLGRFGLAVGIRDPGAGEGAVNSFLR